MKAAPFDYVRAMSEHEALTELAQHGSSARVLAGGQSLVPLMNLRQIRPGVLIDINEVSELSGVSAGPNTISLGAMTRQATALESTALRAVSPLMIEALRLTGNRATRNRGTLGGSVAHADPCGEIPAALLALDATIVMRSHEYGERTIDAESIFVGSFHTAVRDDELVVGIRISTQSRRHGWAFEEVSRQGGRAISGVAALVQIDGDDRIGDIRMAFIGMGETPRRVGSLESGAVGHTADEETLRALSAAFVDRLEPLPDSEVTRDYRVRIARHLGQRALAAAVMRAKAQL
jgi:carbon-monoxide dehydrogenase medium subunit